MNYCTAAYESNLWDFTTKEFIMMTNAWTTGHKLEWNMPRACKTYLVQNMLALHVPYLRAYLLHRGVFFHSLLAIPSMDARVAVLLAAQDQRSGSGSNLNLLRAETGLDPWTVGRAELRSVLAATNSVEVPEVDSW